ncbi:hypothetical protein BV25DRAFT_1922854 [Artomyces pyxidatus]|uniref:Uncharacterized protein n=1 Tax=Artomyces pyxidatus TaxID=48021 RepID=A0ACB8SD63_9AGAM|nr:hypothetical protein BV25DRAFT_1922854 [Artomyces pyxidatus]
MEDVLATARRAKAAIFSSAVVFLRIFSATVPWNPLYAAAGQTWYGPTPRFAPYYLGPLLLF